MEGVKLMTGRLTSEFRNRIVDHFEEAELDVVCRKRKNGYAIYWNDDKLPLAKLRPTGRHDEVEVYQWEDDRWKKVTESGLTLRIDEALEFITDDPDDLFFDSDPDDLEDFSANSAGAEALRYLLGSFLLYAAVGGAVGGWFSNPSICGVVGIATSLLIAVVPNLIRGQLRKAMAMGVLCGLPAALLAGASGTLGGSVNQALGSGVLGAICGISIGAMSGIFVVSCRPLAWGVGFAAGLILGMQLVEATGMPNQVLRFGSVAVMAALCATLLTSLTRSCQQLALSRLPMSAGILFATGFSRWCKE
jgi:hypothetical protein